VFQTFSGHVTLQHFDRYHVSLKFLEIKTGENNKNVFDGPGSNRYPETMAPVATVTPKRWPR